MYFSIGLGFKEVFLFRAWAGIGVYGWAWRRCLSIRRGMEEVFFYYIGLGGGFCVFSRIWDREDVFLYVLFWKTFFFIGLGLEEVFFFRTCIRGFL